MRLHQIQDQRSPIQRLTRKELEYLAKKEGRADVVPGMPVELMRQKFLSNPPAVVPRPMRASLGAYKALRNPPYEEWLRVAFTRAPDPEPEIEVQEVNAMDDLERQWKAQQTPQTMGELRSECKRRGIKIKRTDKMDDLRAKLDGQDAT